MQSSETVFITWAREVGKGNQERPTGFPSYTTTSFDAVSPCDQFTIGERQAEADRGCGVWNIHRQPFLPIHWFWSTWEKGGSSHLHTIKRKDEFRRHLWPRGAAAGGSATWSTSKTAKAKGSVERWCDRQRDKGGRVTSNDWNAFRAVWLYPGRVGWPLALCLFHRKANLRISSGYAGSIVPSVECATEWANPPSQSKSSTEEQPLSPASPSGSPPTHAHNLKSNTSHSAQSEYFPSAENPTTSPVPPLPASPSGAKRATPPPHGHGPRSGHRTASKGGGVQVILGETGLWSELANHSSTLPADGTNGSDGSHRSLSKPHGMLGFLSRKTGRERSPKPKESGVLGKEGARVVISSGKWEDMLSASFLVPHWKTGALGLCERRQVHFFPTLIPAR